MCGPRLSASTRLPYTAGPGIPGPYRLDKVKGCPRGKVLLRAALLAYRRNFCYNTKAACFTTDGKALLNADDELTAIAVKQDGGVVRFTVSLGAMTDAERQILADGCLINYYKNH